MRLFRKTASIFGLLAFLAASGGGEVRAQEVDIDQDNIGYGTRAAEFLLIPVGARPAALGQAATAVTEDATSMYWNPANLGFLQRPSFHVSHYSYVAETSYTWGGVAFPMGADWVIGAQIGGFDFGSQPIYTDLEPDGTGGEYSNSMFVAGLSAAMNVTDRFSFGLTGKYVQESLYNTSGSTVGFDVGTNYHTEVGGRRLMGALAIMNLGSEIELSGSALERRDVETNPNLPIASTPAALRTQSFPLPVMFKVGLAYEALATANSSLMVSGEFWQPQQNNTSLATGLEYTLRPAGLAGFAASLRGGYTYEPDRSFSVGGVDFDDDGTDGLALGGGIAYRPGDAGFNFSLDYAYRNLGLLEGTNMFSVSVGW